MNKYLGFIFCLFCTLSCRNKEEIDATSSNYNASDVTINAVINPIYKDSLSIRALHNKGNDYWFAGSKGIYGAIESGEFYKAAVELDNDDSIEFRSVAVTDNFTYVLSAGNPALLYKIKHSTKNVSLVYVEEGEKVFYDSMKFWNDQEGIALGDPIDDCFSIIKTEDGGDTWGKLYCDMLPDYIEGEVAYAASNSNIAIYNDHVWIATGGRVARIFYSPDRGEQWQVYNTPFIAGEEMKGLYAIDFYDEFKGVAIGGDWNDKEKNKYNKAYTLNGGKSWKLMPDGPGYCSDIMFVPGTNGKEIIAAGPMGIWWTNDLGENWIKISDKSCYTIALENSQKGIIAGKGHISKIKLTRKP